MNLPSVTPRDVARNPARVAETLTATATPASAPPPPVHLPNLATTPLAELAGPRPEQPVLQTAPSPQVAAPVPPSPRPSPAPAPLNPTAQQSLRADLAPGTALAPQTSQPEALPPLFIADGVPVAPAPTTDITSPAPARPEPPPRFVQIIAEAARALTDRPVELTLHPRELGRVRLTLTVADGTMAVSVAVERAETLDLLRRNIDILASQLRDLGYNSLSFSFARQGDGSGGQQERHADPHQPPPTQAAEPETPAPRTHRLEISSSGGIDIRL
ncbi:MAG: flagellar hook-length control protein FliK [Paracoccaceae bacterium]